MIRTGVRRLTIKIFTKRQFISEKKYFIETKKEKRLREVFDSIADQGRSSHQKVGYFGINYLQSPEKFIAETHKTLGKCQSLVQDICSSDLHLVLKKMDMLSDMICQIVDTAEFIRNVDPNERWVEAANEIYKIFGNFLSQLNTHKGLHDVLERVLSDKDIVAKLSDEEKIVGKLFLEDFKKYGVHLNDKKRRELISLNDIIQQLAHSFAWRDSNNPRQQIINLEELLEKRKEMAQLIGHQSFSHFYLKDKMSMSPEKVFMFLKKINERNRPLTEPELNLLASIRNDKKPVTEITSFDRNDIPKILPFPISDYFTVGSIISGASRLFNFLFGIRFEVESCAPGEVWHDDVKKLSVIDENEGKIGTIYMDLISRNVNESPKFNSAAQFTIRCSRRIDNDIKGIFDSNHYKNLELTGIKKYSNKTMQSPVVVLSCNFPRPIPKFPTFLLFEKAEVLMHELGHAVHSMLARTDYQHVSGTRCSLDFVENPSIFTEMLFRTPVITSLISNDGFGLKLSVEHASKYIKAHQSFEAIDTQVQIFCAALDLRYHSYSENSRIDTTKLLIDTHDDFHVFPYVPGTYWQTQFGHLGGYGSVYYSYLWSKEIAKHIYDGSFKNLLQKEITKDGLDKFREAGELYKNEVLKFGGSKNPWDMRWDKFGKDLNL